MVKEGHVNTSTLRKRLEEQGLQGRAVAIERLGDLRFGIERWHEQGLLDAELYQGYLNGFQFSPPDSLPGARSIIIVSDPQAQSRIIFHCHGEAVPAILPPTYVHRIPNRRVQDLLTSVLGPEGYGVARGVLPVKLLAARSGLGQYGKNNVCYVPGLGSFHRLTAFFSDWPVDADHWQEPAMLDRCRNCSACLRRCPTGAITAERFLVHAERCLTWFNERTVEFPAWIDRAWHHRLLGCFHCQRVCPENKPFLDWVETGAEFSEEETALLLDGVPADRLPPETLAKLESLDLMDAYDVLPRNLGLLLQNKAKRET